MAKRFHESTRTQRLVSPPRPSCGKASGFADTNDYATSRLSELYAAGIRLHRNWEGPRAALARPPLRLPHAGASPGFTIVAVLSLAIGIGANCAIFSFADALLLRPLPVARPGEVYTVGSRSSVEAFNASSLVSSYRDYVDIRDRSKSFDGLAAFQYLSVAFASDPRATPKLKMA